MPRGLPVVIVGSLVATSSMLFFEPSIFSLLILHVGFDIFVVGIAMLFLIPQIFGKDPQSGAIPLWSRAIHLPWNLIVASMVMIRRFTNSRKSPPIPIISAISSTPFWLGGWPDEKTVNSIENESKDKKRTPWDAIIDLTAEMPRHQENVTHYRCYPTMDAIPVSIDHLNEAALFAIDHLKEGGDAILVHCAFGIGRSTMTLCACMVATDHCGSWKEAFSILQKNRSIVKLNPSFRERLVEWEKEWFDKRKPLAQS